jgi:uncharacterized protein
MAEDNSGQPVTLSDRILALDVVRGFAMCGVLVAYCVWNLGTAPEETWTTLDTRLGDAIHFLVDGKFYTILAFLFGLGFSIQLSRAATDSTAVETYCRRLAVLAGIGLAHALLLRNGDILLPYALTGFLMIPLRHRSDRQLLAVAFVCVMLAYLIPLLWKQLGLPFPQRPHVENQPYLVENAAWLRYWYEIAPFNWPPNLTLFLFGLLAGRHRLVTGLAGRPRSLVVIAAVGLAGGSALYFAATSLMEMASPAMGAIGGLLFTFHCWCMSSAYVASLLLALRTSAGTAALAPLSAIGRMALTNYLLQAVIVVPLCLRFGWFDTFTPTSGLLLALVIFLIELPFSLAWLSAFQFGPAEWFWRLLTYGKMPPLRRAIATAAAQ